MVQGVTEAAPPAMAEGRRATWVARLRLDTARTWAIIAGLAALILRLPLMARAGSATYNADTDGYLFLANEILHGHFSDPGYSMPGYAGLFAALKPLPGGQTDAMVILQHLVGVGVVVALVYLGRRWFSLAVGAMAGLLAALTPVMLGLEHTLEPDFLLSVVMLAGVALLVEGGIGEQPRTRLLAAGGAVLGVACYLKPVAQVVVLTVPVLLLARGVGWRAALRGTVVAVVALLIIIAPWLARNAIGYGQYTLSNQVGQTLFKRVFEVDGRPLPDTPEGRALLPVQRQMQRLEPDADLNNYVGRDLRAHGASTDEIANTEKTVALQGIKEAPLEYIAKTPLHLGALIFDISRFSWSDLSGGENSSGVDPASRGTLFKLAIGAWFWPMRILTWLWFALALGGLSVVLVIVRGSARARAACAGLAAATLLVLTATALTHGGSRRYAAETAPLYWLFGSAGVAALVSWVKARRAPFTGA